MLYTIGKIVSWLFVKFFGRLRVIGQEHVPAEGGVLLVANHTSYLDPPLVGASVRRPIWYMGKAELFKIPVLGPIIRRVHAFPVKRGTADRQALRTAHELLTSGKGLLVFFEGGRSPDGKLMPPELGAAMIALRADVPIVPVAVINADHILPRGGGIHFGHLTVVIGEPLSFPHLAGKAGDRAALQEVGAAMARAVAQLMLTHGAADRVPDGYLERLA